MATRKLLVRVMNDPNNKRTFKKFRIEEFPEMDVQSTTRMLVDMYGEHLGFSEAERAEIGYIGYSNKKFKITSNDDLQRAFESGELHKNQQAVFYICESRKRALQNELPKMSRKVSITLLLRFKFFICFYNINFFNVFRRKNSPSASVPRRQRDRFGRFLEKQEATKTVEGKITGKNYRTTTFHPRR